MNNSRTPRAGPLPRRLAEAVEEQVGDNKRNSGVLTRYRWWTLFVDRTRSYALSVSPLEDKKKRQIEPTMAWNRQKNISPGSDQ